MTASELSASVTAVAKSAGEARPPGFEKYSADVVKLGIMGLQSTRPRHLVKMGPRSPERRV